MASYDLLTGLPQRRMFVRHIEQILATLSQKKGGFGAILILDIDNFRKINETYDLETGDQILREIGRRLNTSGRPHDRALRTNGDEFAVLLPLLGTDYTIAAQTALNIAEKLHAALVDTPFQTEHGSLSIRVSAGLTMLNGQDTKISQVIQEAGMALHRAEDKGGNCVVSFNACIQTQLEERLSLERDLAVALSAAHLHMDLQPQYDRTGQAVGGELLARWTHPIRGSISPTQFIPIATESGLMPQLTHWSIRVACETLVMMREHGISHTVSVNISPLSLLRADFVPSVKQILETTETKADNLIFEITEEAWLSDLALAAQRMRELNHLGVRFSIDDFGSGFTNLTYLRRLPLDELKIDRSLIQDLIDDLDSQAIIRMILGMARQLGLRVVAEGIETQEQADFLFEHGCNAVQGFWKARPMPIKTWVAMQHP